MAAESQKPGLTLDIDQTLAEGVVEAHMAYYNRALDLGLSAEEVAASGEYLRTFDVPAIEDYRAADSGNEDRFQAARTAIRTSEEVHLALAVIPFSVQQVAVLTAESGPFKHAGYYTVRPDEVEGVTGQWLTAAGYPEPEALTICKDHEDKVRKILNDHILEEVPGGLVLARNPRATTLVDDNLEKLIDAAHELAKVDDAYLEALGHFSIVGFGHDTGSKVHPTAGGMRTYTLPSWEHEHTQALLTDMALIGAAAAE